MRFHPLFLMIVLLAGCPPQAENAGLEGYPCRTGFAANWACNEGLRCMGDDGCVACGDPGQICCFESQTEVCNGAGVACENGNNPYDEEVGVCTAQCGSIGLPCCDGTCPGSGDCVSGTCEAPISNPCFDGGDVTSIVYVVGPDCQVDAVTLKTATAEQAEACWEELATAAAPGVEICKLGEVPEDTEVCQTSMNGTDTLQFPTCSAAQLAVCEQYHCAIDCTWTEGACP